MGRILSETFWRGLDPRRLSYRHLRNQKVIVGAFFVFLLLTALLWFLFWRGTSISVTEDGRGVYSEGFDPKLLSDEKIFTRSAQAGQNCSVTPFSQTLSVDGATTFTAELATETVSPFGFRIGDLPEGASIVFGSPEQRGETRWTVPMTLRTNGKPQQGNFSIPAAYVSGGESTVCQLNVLIRS